MSRADRRGALPSPEDAEAVRRIVALGDVHGQWPELWQALRAAGLVSGVAEPTAPVLSGQVEVVLVGDLVHYKDAEAYALAVGEDVFDIHDSRHLRRAAKAQIRELYRFKTFVERANGHVSVILGNHDEVAVTHSHTLATRSGLEHIEFNPDRGGLAIPADLSDWIMAFPREKIIADIHFSHAGPLPGMQSYDEYFYHDPDTKRWWREKPEYAEHNGCRFGVYGHTVMESIHLDKLYYFAMIDALHNHQYLDLTVTDDDELTVEVVTF